MSDIIYLRPSSRPVPLGSPAADRLLDALRLDFEAERLMRHVHGGCPGWWDGEKFVPMNNIADTPPEWQWVCPNSQCTPGHPCFLGCGWHPVEVADDL